MLCYFRDSGQKEKEKKKEKRAVAGGYILLYGFDVIIM